MTPEQRERIRAAARELGAALTEAGDDFNVITERAEMTTVEDTRRRYVYSITIEALERSVFA